MPTTPEYDPNRDATGDDAIFQECAARLKIAEEAESENRIEGIKALEFQDGDQWDADIFNQRKVDDRPALTINHTQTFVRKIENTLRQQRPRIKCHPLGGGARKEAAEVVNGLIRNIETLSNASIAYDTGGASGVKIGWGYWRIVSDYIDHKSFDQELLIRPIFNTFTVYMDPSAMMPAGEDQKWCIISVRMKRSLYKAKYRNATNADWESTAPGDMDLDWENKEEIRLAEYYRIHEKADTLCMLSNGRAMLKSELDMGTLPAAGLTIIAKRPTTVPQVQWFKLNGTKIVDRKDLPGKYIPIIRCQGNVLTINDRVKRKGMVKDLMDPQRMYNYWRTAETERYALAPKAPWTAYEEVIEGHPEWHSANQKSYSVLVGKAVQGPNGELLPLPTRQNPTQVEAGMMQAAQGAEHDLMAVAGMPPEDPQVAARVMSGNKHLARKLGERDLVHYQYYDNQTIAIMWTGIILLDLIPYYYDTQRMQRIIGEDGQPQIVKINAGEANGIYDVKNNLELGRYDVVMDTGPGYQTQREENAEKTVEALSTPLGEKMVAVGSDLIARDLGMDEMADRLAPTTPEGMEKVVEGLPKEAKSLVTGLLQQIQQLTQTNQQQAMEIKYKGTIEGAKIEAGERKSQRDDATKRIDIATDAATRRDVAEIGAAAQLLNSKMESDQEEKMADKLIERGVEETAG